MAQVSACVMNNRCHPHDKVVQMDPSCMNAKSCLAGCMQVDKALLFAASNAEQAVLPVTHIQRKAWAQKAGFYLAKSGDLESCSR